jgi:hypothetical protein
MSNVIDRPRTHQALPGVPSGSWQIDRAHSVWHRSTPAPRCAMIICAPVTSSMRSGIRC